MLSAVVYEKKNGWYRVGYSVDGKEGKGWLSPPDAGFYRPLQNLLHNNLSSLMEGWNGRLYEYPSRNAPSKTLEHNHPYNTSLGVAKWTTVNGTLWFLVAVTRESACGSGPFPKLLSAVGVGYSVDGKEGKGWLSPPDAGFYRPLQNLLHNNLSSLMEGWNGRLYEYPSRNAPSKTLEHNHPYNTSLGVAKWTTVNGTLWFLVAVTRESACGSGPFPKLLSAVGVGWVPAFNAKGEMNLWFSARGC